jgi:hypothetical protein
MDNAINYVQKVSLFCARRLDQWRKCLLIFGCVANIGGVGPSQLPLVYPSLSMLDDPTPVLPFMAGAAPNQPPAGTLLPPPRIYHTANWQALDSVRGHTPPLRWIFVLPCHSRDFFLRVYLSFRLLLAAVRGKKAIDPAIAARKSSVFQATKEHQPPLGDFEKDGWLHKATAPKQSPQTWRVQTPNRQLPTL